MKQYLDLIKHVLDNGIRKENRTGVDTISTFGYYYEHDLNDGFPLLTTKKIDWKSIVIELLWFLSGSNKSDFLERHGCKFWRPWYNQDGFTVNSLYGPSWRKFHGDFDQIKFVINELKTNPTSRRMVVSAWNPEESSKAPLPACHTMFILNVQNPFIEYVHYGHNKGYTPVCGKYSRNLRILSHGEGIKAGQLWCPDCKSILQSIHGESSFQDPQKPDQQLCLHLTQRSGDIGIGIPYNLASYALLLSLFSRFSGIEPGFFGHSIIDAHVYTKKSDGSMSEYDHIPCLQEQLKRTPRKLPKLIISSAIKSLEDIEELLNPKLTTEEVMSHFVLENYDPHPAIKMKVAV